MRKSIYCILFLLITTLMGAADKPPKANRIISDAKSRAVAEHKSIFLVFGASWCPGCHSLNTFLKDPEVAAIFDKYFVMAELNVAEEMGDHPERNNEGSLELLQKYGGISPKGDVALPFFVVLDGKGSELVTSNRAGKGKDPSQAIGFPTEPEEIRWFIQMMKRGADALTADEAQTIEEKLRKAGEDE
jgi:thioredoxin-related protein